MGIMVLTWANLMLLSKWNIVNQFFKANIFDGCVKYLAKLYIVLY